MIVSASQHFPQFEHGALKSTPTIFAKLNNCLSLRRLKDSGETMAARIGVSEVKVDAGYQAISAR